MLTGRRQAVIRVPLVCGCLSFWQQAPVYLGCVQGFKIACRPDNVVHSRACQTLVVRHLYAAAVITVATRAMFVHRGSALLMMRAPFLVIRGNI